MNYPSKLDDNIYIGLLIRVVAFSLFLAIYYLAASGNWIFDELYLQATYLQLPITLLGLGAIPYLIRSLLRQAKLVYKKHN